MNTDSDRHSFDIRLAVEVGIEKAILLGNIVFWTNENEANKKATHLHQGIYWTYDTLIGIADKYPYLNSKSIHRWMKELKADGWIFIDRFNESNIDKTSWYAKGEKLISWLNNSISQNETPTPQIEIPISQNEIQSSQNETPTPQIEKCIIKGTDINTVINSDSKQEKKGANKFAYEFSKFLNSGFQIQLRKLRKRKAPLVPRVPPKPGFNYELAKNKFIRIDWPEFWTEAMRHFFEHDWLPYHRKRSGRRLTDRGVLGQIKELSTLSESQFLSCLNFSINRNYQGYILEKYQNVHANNQNSQQTSTYPSASSKPYTFDLDAELAKRAGGHYHSAGVIDTNVEVVE